LNENTRNGGPKAPEERRYVDLWGYFCGCCTEQAGDL